MSGWNEEDEAAMLYAEGCRAQADAEAAAALARDLSDAARFLGRMGGQVKSEAKAAAARENGKKGGRPRTKQKSVTLSIVSH